MFEYHLVELDELVLTVRDPNSREHISEAIVAYRARAYRSALMSVWIAVAYDIITKIRELQFNGDKEARDFVDKLDTAIARQQTDNVSAVRSLQEIEKDLLKHALEKFEFLSRQEHTDLERLKHDRNLCAHPAFTGDGLLFQPSPELVRAHITHAVTHLLQHPPVQGKQALVRLKNDILQPSFPTTQTGVSKFLEGRYLNRAKKSLIHSFVAVFLKIILKQTEPDLIGKESDVLRCLIAVKIRCPQIYEQRMAGELPHLAEGAADDNELRRVFRLFQADKHCWNWLSLPIRLNLIEITKSYSYNPADVEHVFSALEIDELRPHLLARVAALGLGEKKQLLSNIHRPEFVDEAIGLLASARSFRDAEAVEELIILPLCSLFRAEQVQRILQAAMENSQIHHASGSLAFFCEIFERTVDLHEQTADAWRTFLTAMSNGKDLNDPYAYSELRGKMSQAGILPA